MISCKVHILKHPFYAQTEYDFTASVPFDIMQQKWVYLITLLVSSKKEAKATLVTVLVFPA